MPESPAWHHRAVVFRDVFASLLVLAAALANARVLADYVFEDSFITYRYARNLAEGLGFVFNPGETVLGTSAPLLTLVLALGARLGADVVALGGILYCLGLAAAGLLGAIFLRRQGYPEAGTLFALLAAWGVGEVYVFFGMETTLHLALILGALIAADADRPNLTGLLLGLVCLNRYDGMVIAFVVGLFLWARRGRPPWREAVIASLLFGAWLTFAQLTFGALTPNTLGAKAGDSGPFEYVAWTLTHQAEKLFGPLRAFGWNLSTVGIVIGWTVLALPFIVVGRRLLRRRTALWMPLGCAGLILTGYAIIGPPLGHQWYHVPGLYLVVLVMLAAWNEAFRRLADRPAGGRWRLGTQAMVWLAVAATAATLPHLATARSAMADGRGTTKIGAYTTFIDYIDRHDLGDTTLLTHEPGFLTYHTGQRAIDAAGLVTPGIYFHGPRDRTSAWHDLLDQHDPDLFMLPMRDAAADPRALETHVPVATDSGQYWLFLNRKLFDRRFDHFYESWLSGPTPETRATADSQSEIGAHDIVAHDIVAHNGEWNDRWKPMDDVPGVGVLESRTFRIDFDAIVFDFFASSHRTLLQLIVDDIAVVTLDGGDSADELRRRALPVYPWRGRLGRLRVVDRDRQGSIRVGRPIAQTFPASRMIDDFEGPAFGELWAEPWADAPTPTSDLARRHGVHFAQGRGVASSLGLEGQPTLTSRPIRVEDDRWLMTIYDFGSAATGVHLWVDGRLVRSWTGRSSQRMHQLMWDMQPYRGREVTLRVRDGDDEADSGIAIDSWLGVDLQLDGR